jgi:hypothetical protein
MTRALELAEDEPFAELGLLVDEQAPRPTARMPAVATVKSPL